MKREIKSMEPKYLKESLDLVEQVFTAHEDAEEGRLVRSLVEEIRSEDISRELIEFGFARALRLGYKAVLVEGNPANYRARGFVTANEHGIVPGASVRLPAIECLMVKELVPGPGGV